MENLIGKRFGKLVVIKETDKGRSHDRRYKCCCDCGNVTDVFAGNLKRGHTTSCGCTKKEIVSAGAHTIHGKSSTRLYKIWKDMRKRCYNPNSYNYPKYGGRGISVCSAWENFSCFEQWAISNGYTDYLSIDRIDNDGNYEPSNCRWTTATEQANNRRSNRIIECDGEAHSIAEWAKLTGISQSVIIARLRLGWDEKRAIQTQKND